MDIKALNVDLRTTMRPFVHTPKNGVRMPMDTTAFMRTLEEKQFLLFDPKARPTEKLNKLMEDREPA